MWRRARVVTLLGGHAWVAAARGTAQECIAYCSKQETRIDGPWTLGEPVKERQRKDLKPLQEACEIIIKGGSLKDVDPTVIAKHGKGLQMVKQLHQKSVIRKVKVVCLVS